MNRFATALAAAVLLGACATSADPLDALQIPEGAEETIRTEANGDTITEYRVDGRVRALKVGDPDDPEAMIGPVINETQLRGLVDRIAEARTSGARELVGGEPRGLLLPPHVFADVTNDQRLAREEIFGPVAPLIRARGEDDALRIANDTDYGLSSCVFTRDVERGVRFAQRIEAGMAHVNDQPVNDLPGSPFGGEKNSGIGRFNGTWAIQAFTTDQWVTLQHQPRPYPTNADELAGPWGGG